MLLKEKNCLLTFIDQEAELLERRDHAEEEAKEGFRNRISTEAEAQMIGDRIRKLQEEKEERKRRTELADYEYTVQQQKLKEMMDENFYKLRASRFNYTQRGTLEYNK